MRMCKTCQEREARKGRTECMRCVAARIRARNGVTVREFLPVQREKDRPARLASTGDLFLDELLSAFQGIENLPIIGEGIRG